MSSLRLARHLTEEDLSEFLFAQLQAQKSITIKNHVNTNLNRMEHMEELIPVHGTRLGKAPESAAAKMDAFNDRWIYRMTVGILGAVMLIGCVGAIILQSNDKEVLDMLLSLGSGAVSALAGLIAIGARVLRQAGEIMPIESQPIESQLIESQMVIHHVQDDRPCPRPRA